MIRYLEYFIAVAEELSFTKAAERLNISQPPLSRQIKNLESELGVTLFNRSNKGVELTDAGKVFLERAQSISKLFSKATDDTIVAHKGEFGELKIGFTSSITLFLIPILQEFQKLYPHIVLNMYEMTTSKQLKGFVDGLIDIGIICPPIPERNLTLTLINQQPFVIVLPDTHPLANRTSPISLIECIDDTFILIPKTSEHDSYVNLIMTIFKENDFFPDKYFFANMSHSVITLVSKEMGVAIVPSSIAKIDIGGVVYKEIAHTNVCLDFALAHCNTKLSNVAKTFISYVIEAVKKEA